MSIILLMLLGRECNNYDKGQLIVCLLCIRFVYIFSVPRHVIISNYIIEIVNRIWTGCVPGYSPLWSSML